MHLIWRIPASFADLCHRKLDQELLGFGCCINVTIFLDNCSLCAGVDCQSVLRILVFAIFHSSLYPACSVGTCQTDYYDDFRHNSPNLSSYRRFTPILSVLREPINLVFSMSLTQSPVNGLKQPVSPGSKLDLPLQMALMLLESTG